MIQVTGTPSQAGTYTFTLQATDSASHTATLVVTIQVIASPVPQEGGVPVPKRWLWTLNAPQPDGSQLAAVGQAQARQLIVRSAAGEHNEASVDIQGSDLAALATIGKALAVDVQVWLEGQPLFIGRLGTERDANDGTGPRFAPTAYSYDELLRRRYMVAMVAPSYSGSDRGFIAWDLISKTQALPGGNVGIARGLNPTVGMVSTATYTKDSSIGGEIDNLAQMDTGFEWEVKPYGAADLRLDLHPLPRNTNKGVVLSWGGAVIKSYERNTDPTTYGNVVYLTSSSGSLTPVLLSASDVATRPEGRWELPIGTELSTTDALTTAAPWYLSASQVVLPSYSIVLRQGAWEGPGHIWVGDLVTVQIKDGRLAVNDLLPVTEMQFDIDAQNVETVTLTVGRSTLRYRQPIRAVQKRLDRLETQ